MYAERKHARTNTHAQFAVTTAAKSSEMHTKLMATVCLYAFVCPIFKRKQCILLLLSRVLGADWNASMYLLFYE